jgi:hypothetical protein
MGQYNGKNRMLLGVVMQLGPVFPCTDDGKQDIALEEPITTGDKQL